MKEFCLLFDLCLKIIDTIWDCAGVTTQVAQSKEFLVISTVFSFTSFSFKIAISSKINAVAGSSRLALALALAAVEKLLADCLSFIESELSMCQLDQDFQHCCAT